LITGGLHARSHEVVNRVRVERVFGEVRHDDDRGDHNDDDATKAPEIDVSGCQVIS
jgi:hypothetical protein